MWKLLVILSCAGLTTGRSVGSWEEEEDYDDTWFKPAKSSRMVAEVPAPWPDEIPDNNDGRSSPSGHRSKRQAIASDDGLWPNGQITYTIEETLPEEAQEAIQEAIAHWENRTCVRFHFRPWKELQKKREELKYVQFVESLGCHSSVGRGDGEGPQDISVGSGCAYAEMMIHEIGHLVGLWHEHARPDRNAYVIILWNNIRPKLEHNFYTVPDARLLTPYDPSSMMHYDMKTFNQNGERTLTPVDPRLDFMIGYRRDLSFYDTLAVNRLYDCSGPCPITSPVCENEGFLIQDCTCYCPRGLTGSRCQHVVPGTGCGGEIDVGDGQIEITSPSYPHQYAHDLDCTWLLRGEEGTRLSLRLDSIDLEQSKYGTCRDQLEVRYSHIGIERGPVFCGQDFNDTLESTTNLMIVHFRSNGYNVEGATFTGFKAVIETFPRTNCDSSPCNNGGECVERFMTNDYYCSCPEGWVGKHCDILVAHGGLSEWSEWSGCVASCGLQTRMRQCNNPVPQNGGLPCQGHLFESKRCQTDRKCSKSFYCDFGTSSDPPKQAWCGIKSDKKPPIQWTLHHAETPSLHTGPNYGHTSGSPEDGYLYLEASNAEDYDHALMWLPRWKWHGQFCIQFYYNLNGASIATLSLVKRAGSNKRRKTIWQHSGDQGDTWLQANINIFFSKKYRGKWQIGFIGVRGDAYDGDMAIDDISISPGLCSNEHAQPIFGCSLGDKRRLPVGRFSYFDKDDCVRINCFCNEDGRVDCPAWKRENIC